MLTRVYIDNFRSFVNFEYMPERKQLLLGPNGSGKTSLLAAISFLQEFIKGDENLFTQSTRTRWQDRPLQVVEIEALLDRKKYEYRVEIRCAPETRRMSVNLERLEFSGKPVFEFVNGQIHFFPDGSDKATALPSETGSSALHLTTKQLTCSGVVAAETLAQWQQSRDRLAEHCIDSLNTGVKELNRLRF